MSAIEHYRKAADSILREDAGLPEAEIQSLIRRICDEPWQTPEERNAANSIVLRLYKRQYLGK